MTSQQIKEVFNAAGIKVRVRRFTNTFRICRIGDVAHSDESRAVAESPGVPFVVVNQPHEMFVHTRAMF